MARSKKKKIRTRDYAMVEIIKGATKSGAHKDHKKEDEKYEGREKVEKQKCIQCGFPFYEEDGVDGFCSETCYDYHTESYSE